MPGLYVVAQLCEYLYKETNLPEGWKIVDKEVGKNFTQGTFGYLGMAFKNGSEIVVVHRGTQLYALDEKSHINPQTSYPNFFTTYSNIYNDLILAMEKVAPEIASALKLGFRVREKYPHNNIIQVGHSLGGHEANIVGYCLEQQAISFDGPGCKQQLEIIFNDKLQPEQFKKHYNILAQKELINRTDTQIGNVYFRKPINNDWRPIDDENLTEKIKITLENHSITTFLACIPPDAPDPSQGISPIFVTPEYYREQGRKQIEHETTRGICKII